MLKSKFLNSLLVGCTVFIGCGRVDSQHEDKNNTLQPEFQMFVEKKKHLNINILLDLSDRINPMKDPKQPSQKDRDIAIIKALCEAFKNNVDAFGAFKAQAKMSVFFHPQPSDSTVARIAAKLNVQCKSGNSTKSAKENKLTYSKLSTDFTSGLNDIYDLAIKAKTYPGSRVFGFMKDEAARYIEDTALYRNILVILTDGYVYHESDRFREGQSNRYSYIERNFEHFSRFRNPGVLKRDFDRLDYGFINEHVDLRNLEVMVLEISQPPNSPIDSDIIKAYWSKWLREMGVSKFDILKSDQTVYTIRELNRFLSHH